jgi:hypothetical protein
LDALGCSIPRRLRGCHCGRVGPPRCRARNPPSSASVSSRRPVRATSSRRSPLSRTEGRPLVSPCGGPKTAGPFSDRCRERPCVSPRDSSQPLIGRIEASMVAAGIRGRRLARNRLSVASLRGRGTSVCGRSRRLRELVATACASVTEVSPVRHQRQTTAEACARMTSAMPIAKNPIVASAPQC